MKKTYGKSLAFLLLTFLVLPLTLRDSLGRIHSINPPVKRLASLSPALTDSLIELGARDLLVGVSSFSHLEGPRKLGGIINPNIEMLISLRPNLVLVMQPTPIKIITEMERLGLEVFSFKEPRSLEEVGETVLTLGLISGRGKTAREKVRRFLERVRFQDKKRGKIFVGFPAPPHWSACRETFLDDLVRRAGWENICRARGWKILSGEEIFRARPRVILAPGRRDSDKFWVHKFPWKALPMERIRVIMVEPNLLLRPTLRLAEVYERLVEE